MRKKDLGGRGRKTLEGESPLFRRGGSLPPNLPLSPRTSPKSTRPCRVKIGFALFGADALGGSFWFWREVQILYMARLRTRFVGNRCSAIMPYTSAGHYIVGNDPCVVPYRGMLLTDLFLCERRLIPPHQSPTAPASPRGEAFLTLCEQGKYHFMLWFAFAIRPHPSPTAANCSQFSSSPQRGRFWCATLSFGLAF